MKCFKGFSILFIIACFFNFGNSFGFSSPREALPCLNKKFTVIVHIVLDTAGQPNITQSQITQNLSSMEAYFAPICATFEICEFRYIPNFQYDNTHKDNETPELIVKYHEENRINIFFVEQTSINGSWATGGGIGVLDGGGIVLIKSVGVGTYAHEMGHYFGLPHTFDDASTFTTELADGSNSATTGDGILDTPADPYVDFLPITTFVVDCRFVYMTQDANGDWYDPHVGNIMSYYPDECRCDFTYDQYKKMANTYLSSNPRMW